MGIFDFIKKKKSEIHYTPEVTKLPEELEKFRIKEIESEIHEKTISSRSPEQLPIEPIKINKPYEISDEKKIETNEKIELIIQKLETIDARLKLIEEKLNKL